jgi:hypothetical protein
VKSVWLKKNFAEKTLFFQKSCKNVIGVCVLSAKDLFVPLSTLKRLNVVKKENVGISFYLYSTRF